MPTPPEDTERRIVWNAARMRVLGLALALLPVCVVLHGLAAPPIVWVLAAANGLVWPWVAWRLASGNPRPVEAERRNLLVDTAMGGVWLALMQFNLVPSAVLASALAMSLVAFGGLRFALLGLVALAAGAGLLSALNEFAFTPGSAPLTILASLPLLLVYPSAIAAAAHRRARQLDGQQKALEALNRTDPLTGLANRRALMEATEHEFRRFRRSGHRATFLLVGADRLKLFNDLHGDAAGDAALQAIAAVLKRTLRDTDTCGRLAGDRFGAVLTDANGSGAGEFAERLRHAVAARVLAAAGGAHPTVSIGFAQIDAAMASSEQWIAAAETALRAAKAAGRNRSMSAPVLRIVAP